MNKFKSSYITVVLSYVFSGSTMVLIERYPDYEGHPDVPLSGPLEILLLAPFAPLEAVFGNFDIRRIALFCFVFLFFYFLLTKVRYVRDPLVTNCKEKGKSIS